MTQLDMVSTSEIRGRTAADMFAQAQRRTLDAALRTADPIPDLTTVPIESIGGRAQVISIGAGPPAVLLGGIGTPAAMWAPLLARLDGLRLHAVDLPGYGLTPPRPDGPIGLAAVDFVGDVIDALGLDRPAIIGSSLGSHWAMRFAAAHPDAVRALVHVGCPALALDTSAPLPMRLLATRGVGRTIAALDRPSARGIVRISKMVGEHPLAPDVAELLLRTQQLPYFTAAFRADLAALLRLRDARPGMSLTPELMGRIDTPTLVVIGRGDPFGAEDVGRRIVDAHPDARLHVTDGGHAPWLRHADRIAPAIRSFLSDVGVLDATPDAATSA